MDRNELAEAYRENAEHAAATNDLWKYASTEANQHLGDPTDTS